MKWSPFHPNFNVLCEIASFDNVLMENVKLQSDQKAYADHTFRNVRGHHLNTGFGLNFSAVLATVKPVCNDHLFNKN